MAPDKLTDIGSISILDVGMNLSRIGVALVVLAIFCGPLCAVQVKTTAAVKQDCHSKPVEKNTHSSIHACCRDALLPSTGLIAPEQSSAALDLNVSEPQMGTEIEFTRSYTQPKAFPHHRSEFAILRT